MKGVGVTYGCLYQWMSKPTWFSENDEFIHPDKTAWRGQSQQVDVVGHSSRSEIRGSPAQHHQTKTDWAKTKHKGNGTRGHDRATTVMDSGIRAHAATTWLKPKHCTQQVTAWLWETALFNFRELLVGKYSEREKTTTTMYVHSGLQNRSYLRWKLDYAAASLTPEMLECNTTEHIKCNTTLHVTVDLVKCIIVFSLSLCELKIIWYLSMFWIAEGEMNVKLTVCITRLTDAWSQNTPVISHKSLYRKNANWAGNASLSTHHSTSICKCFSMFPSLFHPIFLLLTHWCGAVTVPVVGIRFLSLPFISAQSSFVLYKMEMSFKGKSVSPFITVTGNFAETIYLFPWAKITSLIGCYCLYTLTRSDPWPLRKENSHL